MSSVRSWRGRTNAAAAVEAGVEMAEAIATALEVAAADRPSAPPTPGIESVRATTPATVATVLRALDTPDPLDIVRLHYGHPRYIIMPAHQFERACAYRDRAEPVAATEHSNIAECH